MSDAEPIHIALPSHLSVADRSLAVRYLLTPRSLTPEERLRGLEVFDALGASAVTTSGQTQTFAAFYRAQVENKHVVTFFNHLLKTEDPEAVGNQLVTEVWHRIISDLRTMGVQSTGDVGQQCLVVFCGYWWQSFGKGYVREVAVYRDLERSGVEFAAHDLRQGQARFSPHDVTVLGFRGDVKTSTYFLHAARSYPLVNDFYLVRIYDASRRTWLDIAMVKRGMWRVIDGDTRPCELEDVAQSLPTPVLLKARDETLVVITYADWKQRVLRVQAQRKGKA